MFVWHIRDASCCRSCVRRGQRSGPRRPARGRRVRVCSEPRTLNIAAASFSAHCRAHSEERAYMLTCLAAPHDAPTNVGTLETLGAPPGTSSPRCGYASLGRMPLLSLVRAGLRERPYTRAPMRSPSCLPRSTSSLALRCSFSLRKEGANGLPPFARLQALAAKVKHHSVKNALGANIKAAVAVFSLQRGSTRYCPCPGTRTRGPKACLKKKRPR